MKFTMDYVESELYTRYIEAFENVALYSSSSTEGIEARAARDLLKHLIDHFDFEVPCIDVELSAFASEVVTVCMKHGQRVLARNFLEDELPEWPDDKQVTFIMDELVRMPNARIVSVPCWSRDEY